MHPHERRQRSDRRRRPTPALSRYVVSGGRRRGSRRVEENSAIYVDRIGSRVATMLVAIFLCHCLDALFTLLHLGRGGYELNPLMRYVLEFGAGPFLAVKLGTAGPGLVFLGLHEHFPYVRRGIAALLVIYAALVGYHCVLMFHA